MQYQTQEILDLLPHLTKEEKDLLIKAADFAKLAHEGQFRKSGEPYYIHVFETAKNLALYEMDTPTIAAGFLHDVLVDRRNLHPRKRRNQARPCQIPRPCAPRRKFAQTSHGNCA